MSFERSIIDGIQLLSRFVSIRRHLCFTLVGFDTTFEEDEYRFRTLREMGVDPYIMVYNRCSDIRLHHWKRYVNGRVYKVCPDFNDYTPWKKAQQTGGLFL